MTGHPLVLAIWLMEGTAGAIYLAAGWRLLQILPHWRPDQSDGAQLARERSLALVVYQGRWVFGLQLAALAAMVVGISNSWVAHVPGAMCGTGVLQALGAAGRQTLLLRLLTLVLLYCWLAVVRIDHQRPDTPLALTHGRLLLLVAPLLFFSTWRFGQALAAVAPQGAVSCCAELYARAAASAGQGLGGRIAPGTWAAACFSGALGFAAWGFFQWRRPVRVRPVASGLATGVTLLWIGAAVMEIKTTTGPYLLEVLAHPCPWCLFLWEQGGAGFALFGLLTWMAAESAAGLTATLIAQYNPPLAVPALVRVRHSGKALSLAALLFVILATAPILLWRLRFGGWISL